MMNKNLTKKKKKGFTLIELIVVIAILGVLAAVAIPKFGGQTEAAKERADQITAKNIAMAVQTEVAKDATIDTQDEAVAAITPEYFDKLPSPQSTKYSGAFVIVIANGNVSITNGAATNPITLYP